MNKVEVVDLFCGAGGLTHGLLNAGLSVSKGIDIDIDSKYAYEKNNDSKFIHKSITELSEKEIQNLFKKDTEIKVLVGCAPCQTFSTHTTKYKYGEENSRWGLLNSFLDIIKKTKPEVVSMENVPNLVNKDIFNTFVQGLMDMNYNIFYKNIYCSDYGVAQKRRRLVLLASKLGKIEILPPQKNEHNTVKDAIGNIEKIVHGQQSKSDVLHKAAKLSEKNLKRIKQSKQGGTWRDWSKELILNCHKKKSGSTYSSVYGRMKWDKPSPTITTQFYSYGTGRFGHPLQDRALSLREGALLQSFPKNYEFISPEETVSICKVAKLIGNAVPPKLGKVIGLSIKEHIKEVNDGSIQV